MPSPSSQFRCRTAGSFCAGPAAVPANASVAPDDLAVEMALYEGAGTGGRLLGRRECVLADGFSGFAEADFGSVTLEAGEVYTVALENDTARSTAWWTTCA